MKLKNMKLELEWWVVLAVALIAFVIGGLAFMRLVAANADYICTHIIDERGECTNGSWSGWQKVSATDDVASCVNTTVYQRTYTGTRTLRHILQYLNLRTACDSGYGQDRYGDNNGESGFHGGTIITEYSACQISETQTYRGRIASGACEPKLPLGTTTSVSSFDSGPAQNVQSGSKDDLDAYRQSMIKATITANPRLVRGGTPSTVTWQGREVTSCTVAGSNRDGTGANATGAWSGTSGERTTSGIFGSVLYTLTCTAFNGATVVATTSVQQIPVFDEQ